MDIEGDACQAPETLPPNASGASGLLLFMSQLIEDPSNYNANGEILMNRNLISLIRVLIRTEKDRLEADKERDAQMKTMAGQINQLIALQQSGPPTIPPQARIAVPQIPTYASRAAAAVKSVPSGRKPNTLPPAKEELRQLRPGRAVIHSNPLNNQIDKLPRALFVQRANEALAKMNARVDNELVTVTGAHVLNSGDVVFYTKNKFHQRWLMDNKHLWSKQVHTDLEATPSTWSVLVHGIPKDFDPTSEHSKSNIAVANC